MSVGQMYLPHAHPVFYWVVSMLYDVAIIGAGVAGLVCARTLNQAGYQVVLCDKSRGLGGRLATRRLGNTHADHGVCYLKPKGDIFRDFVADLCDRQILNCWTTTLHRLDSQGQLEPIEHEYYASPTGATAVAKHLAQGLNLDLNQRIIKLERSASHWQLTSEQGKTWTAKSVVIAIPAPQAVELLATCLDEQVQDWIPAIQAVEFSPCITAIAAYSTSIQTAIAHLNLQGIICQDDAVLGWIGFDSTKQMAPQQPALILQSNAQFAAQHFAEVEQIDNLTDGLTQALTQMGNRLCDRAATLLNLPWIQTPELIQVHRWRYAFALNPRTEKVLEILTAPLLLCTGDWCGGDRVEDAFLAGIASAERIKQVLL
jgi:renalase